ncbi:MAG TPA: ABATE domain-containing protein [Pseudonocardiaceae bacterium]|nr:ABATE domain-containing protein [Pseudonocardiaceae bacterium]
MFELLFTPPDVARWLGVVADMDEVEASEPDVERGRALRRATWDAAHAAIDARPPVEADRVVINQAAAHPPPVPTPKSSGSAAVARAQ